MAPLVVSELCPGQEKGTKGGTIEIYKRTKTRAFEKLK
jgi:hypothetical protein